MLVCIVGECRATLKECNSYNGIANRIAQLHYRNAKRCGRGEEEEARVSKALLEAFF